MDLTFTDIREEATLLIQDEDSDQQQVDQCKDDIDVPVYAPWASNIFRELIANRHIPVFNGFWVFFMYLV
jgi:hypothetical protein